MVFTPLYEFDLLKINIFDVTLLETFILCLNTESKILLS